MQSAPVNSVFVWHGHYLPYPKALAMHLNRPDLTIVGPGFITQERWRGTINTIVIDHFTQLSYEHFLAISDHNRCVNAKA